MHGYTNNCYPINVTQSQVLNVTYYDDYDWITDAAKYGFSTAEVIAGTAKTTNNVIGYATGTKTKVLGITGDQWLTSVTYYDNDYNAIQTVSDLYPSGVDGGDLGEGFVNGFKTGLIGGLIGGGISGISNLVKGKPFWMSY